MKFLKGKNDFLFLDNDTNGTILQTCGNHRIDRDVLCHIYDRHCVRHQFLADYGAAYFHIIPPNKETVLSEYLPDGIKYQEFGKTPVNMYMDFISDHADRGVGSILQQRTFYRPELLINLDRAGQTPYYRTDTHWNHGAAALYLREFLIGAGLTDVVAKMDQMVLDNSEVSFLGDLGKVAEAASELVVERRPQVLLSKIIYAGNIINEGYIRHTIAPSPAAVPKRLLVIHDSFTHWLFPIISEIFAEVFYIHTPDVDLSFVRKFAPDYMFFIQVERFLPRLIANEIEYPNMLRKQAEAKSVDGRSAVYIEGLLAKEE